MYLSCLLVNVGMDPDQPRPGRVWLGNVYAVHQRLCMAFPDQARRARDPRFLKPHRAMDFAKGRGVVAVPNSVGRDGTAGLLFRIDHQPSGAAAILALSTLEPDWHYAFQNAGMLLAAPPQVKPYQPRFSSGDSYRFRILMNLSTKQKKPVLDENRKPKFDEDGQPILKSRRFQFTWEGCSKQQGSEVQDIGKSEELRAVIRPWFEMKTGVRERTNGDASEEALPGHRPFALREMEVVSLGWVAGYKPKPRGQDGALPTPGSNHKVQHDTLRFRSALLEGVLRVEDAAAFTKLALGGIGAGKAFGFGLLSLARLP